eukprot:jgi/Tetstr1/434403/TSEL_023503.t1
MDPLVDLSDRRVQAQIQAKASLRDRHEKGKGGEAPAVDGLPPGQRRVKTWVVLDLGVKPGPQYDPSSWQLQVASRDGAALLSFSQEQLQSLGTQEYTVDWHCVTGWSTPGVHFLGVPLRRVIEACRPSDSWVCLMQTGEDGYTVNVHREDALHEDAFLALAFADGSAIPPEHGGPRIVLPHLFGWKSCKWLREIAFLEEHSRGFWERFGCNMRGRVALNERWEPRAKSTWNFLVGILNLYYWVIPESAVVRLMQVSAKVLGFFTLSESESSKGGKSA